jgi:hypothetical protein
MTRQIIGLIGYGGVGKDEVGQFLIDDHKFVRYAKGDLIKEAALLIDPVIPVPHGYARLAELVSKHGWLDAKKIDGVRRFLQDLPDQTTEVLGFDPWNAAVWKSIQESESERIVLTRLCLPSEVERLRAQGGKLLRVERPGFGPANDHPNEVALDKAWPDAVLVNDGSLDDLRHATDVLLGKIFDPDRRHFRLWAKPCYTSR